MGSMQMQLQVKEGNQEGRQGVEAENTIDTKDHCCHLWIAGTSLACKIVEKNSYGNQLNLSVCGKEHTKMIGIMSSRKRKVRLALVCSPSIVQQQKKNKKKPHQFSVQNAMSCITVRKTAGRRKGGRVKGATTKTWFTFVTHSSAAWPKNGAFKAYILQPKIPTIECVNSLQLGCKC